MDSGYILLWRKFRDWEYYTDVNVRIIYQDLILSANWQDKRFQGIVIKKGQRLTSYQKLADANSLSVQQVRTALKKLINSGYITQKTFNKYQIITILDYAKYQDFSKIKKNNQKNNKQKTEYFNDINEKKGKENEQDNNQITNNQQTNNNKQCIINTLKTLKNKNSNILSGKKTPDRESDFKEIIEYLNQNANTNYKHSGSKTKKLIQTRMREGFKTEDFKKVIDIKTEEWQGTEFAKFLRPETLFSNKFESYLNQKPFEKKTKTDEAVEQYELVKNENTRSKANKKALAIYKELSQHFRQMSEFGIAFYSDGNVNVKSEFLRKYRKGGA